MKLGQAVNKLAQCDLHGFNVTTSLWELLPFKVIYSVDGRFIGRSVSFYNRRVFICPQDIPLNYPIIKIGKTDSEPLMIYASQENINRNESYLFSFTGFNIQGNATIHRLVKTQSASGMGGKATDSVHGIFPVALEKGFSGPANLQVAGAYNSRVSCYIPSYAGVELSDTLEFEGEFYTIDELLPELRLTFLQLTKK